MPTYLTDSAVCLRVTDFSETSQIVNLFTRTHGLIPLIAKGSKRNTKKNTMSGPLDLLTTGEVVFIPAKGTAELATLTGWELTNHRAALRKDLSALNAAMLGAETTTHLLHPHDPHPDLFTEFEATLELLPTTQRPRAVVAYIKAALHAAGYAPQLATCLSCGKSLTQNTTLHFSPRAGGVACCHIDGTTIAVAAKIILALDRLPSPSALLQNPPDRPADTAALNTAIQLLLAQIDFTTSKPLRTRYLLPSIFEVRLT